MAPFILNTSSKALSPNTLVCGGAESWGFNIGVVGDTIQPQQRHCFLLLRSLGMCSGTMGRGRGLHAKCLQCGRQICTRRNALFEMPRAAPERTLLINAQASSICPHPASFNVSHLSCTFRKSPQTVHNRSDLLLLLHISINRCRLLGLGDVRCARFS